MCLQRAWAMRWTWRRCWRASMVPMPYSTVSEFVHNEVVLHSIKMYDAVDNCL
jgi:hypothetical protein